MNILLFLLSAPQADAFQVLRFDNDSPSVSAEHRYTLWLQQFNDLKNHNYRFVSLAGLQQSTTRSASDSSSLLLIVVDHPDQNFFYQGYPLFKLLHIPVVLCVSAQTMRPGNNRLTWNHLEQMLSSGLVELANAGFALDQTIIADPQGDRQPAATTRRFRMIQNRYETEEEYRHRIENDLQRNNLLFEQRIGYRFHLVSWPAGAYNLTTLQLARQLNLTTSLDEDANTNLSPTARVLHQLTVSPSRSAWELIQQLAKDSLTIKPNSPRRVMHVNLDYLYDANAQQEQSNIAHLLERINAMEINTVYLQAFADPDGNGAADAVYFPNHQLPVRQDLFNHVAWMIHSHTPVQQVYAWMPLLAWQLPERNPEAHDQVVTLPSRPNHVDMGYPRLSPFSKTAHQLIASIYEDLARYAFFNGLLFHDDATLSDYEDDSAAAHVFYKQMHLPVSVAAIRQNPQEMERWTLLKTMTLDQLALDMANRVRQEHPTLHTARNLYAQVVLHPEAETWYAQSLKRTLQDFDYAAIEAMPYMENAPDHSYFYHDLLERVKAAPHGLEKTVFELQTKDWRSGGTPIATTILAQTVCMLYGWGVQNLGYIPDDQFRNNPDPQVLRPALEHHCPLTPPH